MNSPSKIKWIILISSFLAMFSFLFSMQSIPPIIPEIIKEFKVDYATVSTLMLLVALPSVVLSIFLGFLAQKYGVKRTTGIGLILVSVGSVLSSLANSFIVFQIARLVIGLGGALIAVIAPLSIYQFFERREMGLAMGVIGQAMPFATVIAFNTLGVIQVLEGWRYALAISAIISVLCLFVYILTIKEKRREKLERLDLTPLKNVNIWLLGLIWGFFNMAAIGYSTWGNTLFFEFNALSPSYSDFLASTFMLGGFVCPLAGYLSDRAGKRKLFMIISTLGISIVFLAFIFINQNLFLPFAILLGIFDFLLPPAIFALPEEILGKENGGLGMGVLNSCLNVGVVVGPTLIGVMLDLTRSEAFSFLMMSSYMIVALILTLILKSR